MRWKRFRDTSCSLAGVFSTERWNSIPTRQTISLRRHAFFTICCSHEMQQSVRITKHLDKTTRHRISRDSTLVHRICKQVHYNPSKDFEAIEHLGRLLWFVTHSVITSCQTSEKFPGNQASSNKWSQQIRTSCDSALFQKYRLQLSMHLVAILICDNNLTDKPYELLPVINTWLADSFWHHFPCRFLLVFTVVCG